MNKTLVCITIQENSKRLIKEGYRIANDTEAELHILNIRKGDTIFDQPSNSTLFEELFVYGSELGGQAHFLCSNNVHETIFNFIKNNGITHLVIGSTPTNVPGSANVYDILHNQLKDIEIIVLDNNFAMH